MKITSSAFLDNREQATVSLRKVISQSRIEMQNSELGKRGVTAELTKFIILSWKGGNK